MKKIMIIVIFLLCLLNYNAHSGPMITGGAVGTGGGGTGDVESVGDCTSGACLDGSSDGGTYIRLYDGDSHYTGIYAGNSSANLSFYFPTAAGAAGSIMYFTSATQLAPLAIRTVLS